jgi:hypothetical protein
MRAFEFIVSFRWGGDCWRIQEMRFSALMAVLLQKTGGLWLRLMDFPRSSHTGSLLPKRVELKRPPEPTGVHIERLM